MTIARVLATVAACSLVLFLLLLFAGCGQPNASERHKPLLDTYVRAWNTGDFKGLEDAGAINSNSA